MLDLTITQSIAHLRLHHPPANVLDLPMLERLQAICRQLQTEEAVHFVILESALEGKFSAGVSVPDHAPDKAPAMIRLFHTCLWEWSHVPQVTLAAVDGYALGGAAEMLLLTDFVIATDRSTFGFPEIQLAFFPPVALAFLPDWIGYHRALSLILRGEPVGAEEWSALGLLESVVTPDVLYRAVEDLIGRLRHHSQAVVQLTRRLVKRHFIDAHWARLEAIEHTFIHDLLQLQDPAEGVRAFVEKRKPVWSHR